MNEGVCDANQTHIDMITQVPRTVIAYQDIFISAFDVPRLLSRGDPPSPPPTTMVKCHSPIPNILSPIPMVTFFPRIFCANN